MRILPLFSTFAMLATLLGSRPALADDKYHITTAERAACSTDAVHFCMWSYPDEDKLLNCMKANREALSASCRVAFDAGVKRRRL